MLAACSARHPQPYPPPGKALAHHQLRASGAEGVCGLGRGDMALSSNVCSRHVATPSHSPTHSRLPALSSALVFVSLYVQAPLRVCVPVRSCVRVAAFALLDVYA